MRRLLAAVAVALSLLLCAPAAVAAPPTPYQCPNSQAHVWDKRQCKGTEPFGFPGSGGGGNGGGLIGRILDRVTGGIL